MSRLLSIGAFQIHHLPSVPQTRLFASSQQNIAIVGGGLAGLSTAFHLLEKLGDDVQITIFDKTKPGAGGASSVAGGLLHPFSPRGKLVHLGIESLSASNRLLDFATKNNSDCVVRDRLYRIALTEKNVGQLKITAELHPEYATWLEPLEVEKRTGTVSLGGLLLTNGCQVIHVPSYLQGLWEACQELSPNNIHWQIDDPNTKPDWKVRLEDFDTVVLSAGSGLFHDSIVCNDASEFPVDLVRGQSIEMSIDSKTAEDYPNEAILCGKYFTPIPNSKKVLIGATHEYKSEAFDAEEVVEELKSRSYDVSPFVWDNGSVMRMTCGYRVQTRRGNLGRMPIIGQMKNCNIHDNAYVFTGLSARGLIYHGMYGDLLSSMIVAKDESLISDEYPHLLWWKQ